MSASSEELDGEAVAPPLEPQAEDLAPPSGEDGQEAPEETPGLAASTAEQVVRLSSTRRSRVADVGVALPETHGRVVIAEVDEPHRTFAIPVSLDQASMIATLLRGIPRRRPFMADVLVDVLNQFALSVAMVVITGRQGDLYFAELTLFDKTAQQRIVPARPSDAILIALASSPPPPIMVDEALFGPA
ncbi:MAG: DUF151 domain-containing protein [Actinomycetota bacterium]|nr:DUF151 domain-containing protein [Actinomycetota bacterium]MDA8207458.1 DUF151 domain-containing protein [Actinomycetota bacterium]